MTELDKKIYKGKVIFFSNNRGYGFIQWTNDQGQPQEDMFVHFSDINCAGFKTLKKDSLVSFELGENKHGEPKAVNVTVIDVN